MMVFIPLLAALLYINKDILLALSRHLPKCKFYQATGMLCPACGNTRSVVSLLNGEPLRSVGYNITPMLLIVIAIAFYIEITAFAFGIRIRIFPRSYSFLMILMTILSAYYVLRNFLPFLTLC